MLSRHDDLDEGRLGGWEGDAGGVNPADGVCSTCLMVDGSNRPSAPRKMVLIVTLGARSRGTDDLPRGAGDAVREAGDAAR